MQEVLEFFRGLLATDRWPARWKCGYWSDFHGWLYIISDLMIFLSYFIIPVFILSYFQSKKTAIRFQAVYLLFAAFIVLCGTTHLLDAMMFWVPAYRFNALVRLATGVVSMLTVYQLIKTIPQMVKQRTSLELESEIVRREQVEKSLAEANGRLAAFATIASHDLQEPLRKIQTFAGMLYDEQGDTISDQHKGHLTKIVNSAERMHTLIKDVLILSSIAEKIDLQAMNPEAAVQDAQVNLELAIKDKKAVITVHPLPVVMGHPAYLTQLFTNLIGNAMKFSEGQPEINISGETINRQVIIRIKDNGIGIPQEYLGKIFDAFERGQARYTHAGTGMGLAICKRVMEIHQGSISVQNNEGGGTTFILVFPDPNAGQGKIVK